MRTRTMRALDPGVTCEVDAIREEEWYELLGEFEDANIYQTWSYASATWGLHNTSHLVLKRTGYVIALAQVRILKIRVLNIGIAYVRWGPMWRRRSSEEDYDTFRQAVRALRNEFTCKRGLALRLFPPLIDEDAACYSAILREEGYVALPRGTLGRTIIIDLNRPIDELREGMMPHWKRELKVAERKQLEVIEGDADELFADFIKIYKEMVSRKRFVEPNDINQFRSAQDGLPRGLKMWVMLCKSGGELCAGLVCSAIGTTAIYLFGATSNNGMKSRGSYLLHWNLLKRLKDNGIVRYNLNGINPARNPGTYKFKSDFAGKNGKEVHYLGSFESTRNEITTLFIHSAELVRRIYRTIRALRPGWRTFKMIRPNGRQNRDK